MTLPIFRSSRMGKSYTSKFNTMEALNIPLYFQIYTGAHLPTIKYSDRCLQHAVHTSG